MPVEDPLVIRREVNAGGRSRCWVNDIAVTAGRPAAAGAQQLLAILGQHEQHGLADARVQRQLVDEFGGHARLAGGGRRRPRRWAAAAAEVDAAGGGAGAAARPPRRDQLPARRDRRASTRARRGRGAGRAAAGAASRGPPAASFGGSLLGRSGRGRGRGRSTSSRAPVGSSTRWRRVGFVWTRGRARLDEARVLVEEVVREVQSVIAEVDQDPAELDGVESRLHRLEQSDAQVRRAAASGSSSTATGCSPSGSRSTRWRTGWRRRQTGRRRPSRCTGRRPAELDRSRRRAGDELVAEVAGILGELRMAGTRLELRWQPQPDPGSPLLREGQRVAFGPEGVEECELLIAPNPGEEPRPMARIASGGELSRIHLALRTAMRGRRRSAGLTLLFDEVDSGLGGGTAAALAGLLASLARDGPGAGGDPPATGGGSGLRATSGSRRWWNAAGRSPGSCGSTGSERELELVPHAGRRPAERHRSGPRPQPPGDGVRTVPFRRPSDLGRAVDRGHRRAPQGGVVLLPTETFYGSGGRPLGSRGGREAADPQGPARRSGPPGAVCRLGAGRGAGGGSRPVAGEPGGPVAGSPHRDPAGRRRPAAGAGATLAVRVPGLDLLRRLLAAVGPLTGHLGEPARLSGRERGRSGSRVDPRPPDARPRRRSDAGGDGHDPG